MLNTFTASFTSISDIKKKKYDGSEPVYELDLEKIKGLTKALKKTYPDVYRPLLEARASFLGKSKERSHPSQSDKLGSFDYSKDV